MSSGANPNGFSPKYVWKYQFTNDQSKAALNPTKTRSARQFAKLFSFARLNPWSTQEVVVFGRGELGLRQSGCDSFRHTNIPHGSGRLGLESRWRMLSQKTIVTPRHYGAVAPGSPN